MVITLLRLGDLNRFISHAVIVGFTLGAGVLIVLDQVKNLLGLGSLGGGHDHFLKRFWLTIANIRETNRTTLLLGLATAAIALLLRWINVRLRIRLPEFLTAIIVVAASVWAWSLEQQGVRIVGEVPAALPSFQWPEADWERVHALLGGSLAIAMLGLLEAISMAKAIASQTRQKLDINQQCLSESLANLAGSFFSCYPGSGSLTRSTINQQAGAQTQWSGVISAVAVALTVLLFAPYAYYIPRSALAAILVLSAWRLIDWPQLSYYLRATRYDACIVVATAVSAVAISVEFCVLIGVLLSFILYVPRAARVHLTELVVTPERLIRERFSTDAPCGRIRIFSLEGELFFGAAPELEQHLNRIAEASDAGIRVVILRLKRARNPDAVCLQALEGFVDRMREAGVAVVLCGIRPELMHALESGGIVKDLGVERCFVFEETGAIWTSTLEAVRFAYQLLGGDVCEICPRHAASLNDKDGWSYSI
jgi:SulP family sulfate permease